MATSRAHSFPKQDLAPTGIEVDGKNVFGRPPCELCNYFIATLKMDLPYTHSTEEESIVIRN